MTTYTLIANGRPVFHGSDPAIRDKVIARHEAEGVTCKVETMQQGHVAPVSVDAEGKQ